MVRGKSNVNPPHNGLKFVRANLQSTPLKKKVMTYSDIVFIWSFQQQLSMLL